MNRLLQIPSSIQPVTQLAQSAKDRARRFGLRLIWSHSHQADDLNAIQRANTSRKLEQLVWIKSVLASFSGNIQLNKSFDDFIA